MEKENNYIPKKMENKESESLDQASKADANKPTETKACSSKENLPAIGLPGILSKSENQIYVMSLGKSTPLEIQMDSAVNPENEEDNSTPSVALDNLIKTVELIDKKASRQNAPKPFICLLCRRSYATESIVTQHILITHHILPDKHHFERRVIENTELPAKMPQIGSPEYRNYVKTRYNLEKERKFLISEIDKLMYEIRCQQTTVKHSLQETLDSVTHLNRLLAIAKAQKMSNKKSIDSREEKMQAQLFFDKYMGNNVPPKTIDVKTGSVQKPFNPFYFDYYQCQREMEDFLLESNLREQMTEVTEPSEVETVAEPYEMETISEPSEIETVSEPSEMETVTEPFEMETVTEPSEMETVTEPSEIETIIETSEAPLKLRFL